MARTALLSAFLTALFAPVIAGAQTLDDGAELLRSDDPFDRQRGEVELRGLGVDALPRLVVLAEAKDRLFRFRAMRVFQESIESLLRDLDSEQNSMFLDRNELSSLNLIAEAFELRRGHGERLDAMLQSPEFAKRLGEILPLEELESREKAYREGELPILDESAPGGREAAEKKGEEPGRVARLSEEIARLRAKVEEWKRSEPDFDEKMAPLVRLARLEASGLVGRELSELEQIRKKELEERIAEREPRIAELVKKVELIGPAAVNALLARRLTARPRGGGLHAELAARAVEKFKDDLVPPDSDFDAKRYHRSLIWVRELDSKGPRAEACGSALETHIEATLADLDDPEPVVKERAEDELYVLGERGRSALEQHVAKDPAKSQSHKFLLGLLRWRIRPSVHARVGLDFEEYKGLGFRERRGKVFAYAYAAGEDAVPTLRAIVMDDDLEPSFFVKIAAAQALASPLRDMLGYNYLLAKHPSMTLRKPEISRQILIIQAYEHIRENNYQKAVEELRKLLDEDPFDFQGNYHIAFAYLLLKNYTKSIHHFEIARRINPQDHLTLYNLACAYALSGKKSEALEALERSVEAGFADHGHMEKDPDLQSLRDDSRFQRLIEKMQQGS